MSENGNEETKDASFTFFTKKTISCPLCDHEFYREEIKSGGGRLIAGQLTMDLRRLYEVNKKFGVIMPLLYSVTVCPECYYSALHEDFQIPGKAKESLEAHQTTRTSIVQQLFPNIDFNTVRTIEHGLLSYILAVDCYKLVDKRQIPTLKRAICSIRASWIAEDMAKHYNNPVFTTIQQIFSRKSAKYYGLALGYSQNGTEPFEGTKNIGPDTDRNWGYDGFLYLAGYLNYQLALRDTNDERKGKTFVKVKRIMGKLYGGGKASKDKPTIILNNAKDLYDEIRKNMKALEEKTGTSLE